MPLPLPLHSRTLSGLHEHDDETEEQHERSKGEGGGDTDGADELALTAIADSPRSAEVLAAVATEARRETRASLHAGATGGWAGAGRTTSICRENHKRVRNAMQRALLAAPYQRSKLEAALDAMDERRD